MKTIIALQLFLISTLAFGIPQDFETDGYNATFVDFKKVEHVITVNPGGRFTTVKTTIELNQINKGNILFDFRAGAKSVFLDGKRIKAHKVETPKGEIELNMLDEESAPGPHTFVMNSILSFSLGGKRDIYFKMRDLYGWFLDRNLPANLEYDQHPVTIKLKLNLKDAAAYRPMTNARTSDYDPSLKTWTLEFPEYFTTSSLYFHVVHTSNYHFLESKFTTSSGRVVPITVYGKPNIVLEDYEKRALEVLKELEADYGEYAHPSFLINARGSRGGMEFSGGAETSLGSLGHEIFHNYFGRGVLPSDGNSGFLDEALASWRDYGYQNSDRPNFKSSNVAGHSPYRKGTDKRSYKLGRSFFSYIDPKLSHVGGLKAFMASFYKRNIHKTVTIDSFLKELNEFSGMDFTKDFDQYLR